MIGDGHQRPLIQESMHACGRSDATCTALCRDLQPPPPLVADWNEQREELLRIVAEVLEGSVRGDCFEYAMSSSAIAHADAVAAAELAMQELLVGSAATICPTRDCFAKAQPVGRINDDASGRVITVTMTFDA